MQSEKSTFDLRFNIPFGVEIEVNAFDLKSRPDEHRSGALPMGIYEIASLVNEASKDRVFVSKWTNNHDNNYWVVKPDASCGLEVCSPVLKGSFGAKTVSQVVAALRQDSRIKSDSRCSFHVHFDISSFSPQDLLAIISWWIKLESFFMDAMPAKRKINPYCRLIAQSNIISDVYQSKDLPYFVEKLGVMKYHTLNTFHYYNKKRKSIEFRIMDNLCCLSPNDSFHWISLLHHFINCAVSCGVPSFTGSDPYSGYCWLDPFDAFKFLKFDDGFLPPKLCLVRDWLIERLLKYGNNYLEFGIFSESFKDSSYKEICGLKNL
jgi:hypothetical protein